MFETHPYNNFEPIPPGTETLIIGTAPPPRFSLPRPPHKGPKKGYDADFYYGSGANYLWVYLEKAANEPTFAEPSTAEAEKEDTEKLMRNFLSRHKLWMRDILQKYRRKKEGSASDKDIDVTAKGTEYIDLAPLLKENMAIHKIAFTSQDFAAKWTFEALKEQGLIDGFDFNGHLRKWKEISKLENEVQRYKTPFARGKNVGGRIVDFYILPTPSGAGSASLSEQDIIEVYRTVLFPYRIRAANDCRA